MAKSKTPQGNASQDFTNQLHYGDNLQVLREKIPDDSVDLIYLDPPFNSARSYNLLFKRVKGDPSPAQIMAFEDTWTWSPHLYIDFREDQRNSRLWELIDSLKAIIGESEMMAYLLMMAPRLLELHHKLKRTGSLYLHCDPVASHYLKIILDVIFGPENFRNEITWKRTSAHSDAKLKFPNVADIVLYYSKSSLTKFQPVHVPHDPEYVNQFYRHDDNDGRGKYRLDNMAAPEGGGMSAIKASTGKPNGWYIYKGYEPPARGWRYSPETMERLDSEGRIYFPTTSAGDPDTTKRLCLKRYLNEQKGSIVTNVWTDIPPVQGQGAKSESRGYPTQKPLALLERIIAASSNPGDIVLDPFCGCGTAVVAAERMGRHWIGIDVTLLAVNEITHRLRTEGRADQEPVYKLIGTPVDADGAARLFADTKSQNHKPFEQFCVTLAGGEYRDRMGADGGVDGIIHLTDIHGKLQKIVIQVKGGNGLNLSNVRDFAHVIKSKNAVLGLMISMKEPTHEMKLVAENMGYADWPTQHRYPRMQIRTVKQLLEAPLEPFEIPDSYRIARQTGVGKASPNIQAELNL